MAMRLYTEDDIVSDAKSMNLIFEERVGEHLIFKDSEGEPYSIPCPECGCPDYLYDIFMDKIKNGSGSV